MLRYHKPKSHYKTLFNVICTHIHSYSKSQDQIVFLFFSLKKKEVFKNTISLIKATPYYILISLIGQYLNQSNHVSELH